MFPQLPPLEQQVPNDDPTQVLEFFVPHTPSVEMEPLPLLQVPKLLLQPAPQCVVDEPHRPLDEQQSPNPEPLQVLPLLPHCPSVEMVPLPLLQPVPKPLWHPAPQWSAVLPQKPLREQQLPNVDPLHVFPLLPHRPSVETPPEPTAVHVPKPLWQPVPQWDVDVPQNPLGEQQSPKAEPLHVLPLLPHCPSTEIFPDPDVQVPKVAWHPVPQCAVVAPQYPLAEQQSPKPEPLHVFPFLTPHCPSVEMVPLPLLQTPNDAWQPASQCSELPQ